MSSSDSDSSSSSDTYHDEMTPLDEFGRPIARPAFCSISASSVLERAKAFLPLFRKATMQLIEPEIIAEHSPIDVVLPTQKNVEALSDYSDSEASFGVEIDVGLGVFDVTGNIDYSEFNRSGIPIIETRPENMIENTPTTVLIKEIGSTTDMCTVEEDRDEFQI